MVAIEQFFLDVNQIVEVFDLELVVALHDVQLMLLLLLLEALVDGGLAQEYVNHVVFEATYLRERYVLADAREHLPLLLVELVSAHLGIHIGNH